MSPVDSEYANTDFDIRSATRFDALHAELSAACCMLHYSEAADGSWWASYEADQLNPDAATDIMAMLAVVESLSDAARAEFSACYMRDFNIGFHCWDSWAYNHALPASVVSAVARAGCSMSITLYPMRGPDGTPKVAPEEG